MLDRQYVFFPEPWQEGAWGQGSGLPLEEVWLKTQDGLRLFAWYVEAPDSPGVLLWCHGNAGNVIARLDNLVELHRRGLSTLIFDYRGYGQSEGAPDETGLYLDVQAAWAYLTSERKIPPHRIIAYGRSLGAAVAGELARSQPVAGLILESPFPSVKAVARRLLGGLPVELMLKSRFDLARRLKAIQVPVLVLHGDQDTVIPFDLGETVYQAAQEPKAFYRIAGADHNDTYIAGGEPYFKTLVDFVRTSTGKAQERSIESP